METYLGLYIPIKKCKTQNICDTCVCVCEIGLPQVKKNKTEPKPKKPEEKKCDKNHCELDVEKWFTKARTDKGKCTISEYMDTISRNGANFFEMKKDLKFNDNMDAPSV